MREIECVEIAPDISRESRHLLLRSPSLLVKVQLIVFFPDGSSEL